MAAGLLVPDGPPRLGARGGGRRDRRDRGALRIQLVGRTRDGVRL